MSHATPGRWVRLQDGEDFVGNLWSGSNERQRRETLIGTLWSGQVPMRARTAMKPRKPDLSPELPSLEAKGLLGTTTPAPGVEVLLLAADPRTITLDIPAGRIVISGFILNDDKGLWAACFPGWLKTAAGRFLVIEMDDIEFDAAAARAYAVENILPDHRMGSDDGVAPPEAIESASPQPTENVIQFPYRTGAAGRPTSWDLIEGECRRRYDAGERHPGKSGESRTEWARLLIGWLKLAHAGAPVPQQKTLTNKLGALLRELAGNGPLPAS